MRRVLLIFAHRLFGMGVANLLQQAPGLAIWSCDPDRDQVLDRMSDVAPDVVIVERCLPGINDGDLAKDVLRSRKQVTVIELDLKDNMAWIYAGQSRTIGQVADLVQVIEQVDKP